MDRNRLCDPATSPWQGRFAEQPPCLLTCYPPGAIVIPGRSQVPDWQGNQRKHRKRGGHGCGCNSRTAGEPEYGKPRRGRAELQDRLKAHAASAPGHCLVSEACSLIVKAAQLPVRAPHNVQLRGDGDALDHRDRDIGATSPQLPMSAFKVPGRDPPWPEAQAQAAQGPPLRGRYRVQKGS